MRNFQSSATRFLRSFWRNQDGVSSIEIVLVFPWFLLFFLMVIESGVISIRHVMLERALDLTAREVRIGRLENPSREALKTEVCARAIVADCMNQLNMEIVVLDPRAWGAGIPAQVTCVDRGNPEDADNNANQTGNNQLVFLRACARFDPFLPFTGLGRAIYEGSKDDTAAAGSFALVASTSFVVEPFQRVNNGTTTGAGS